MPAGLLAVRHSIAQNGFTDALTRLGIYAATIGATVGVITLILALTGKPTTLSLILTIIGPTVVTLWTTLNSARGASSRPPVMALGRS